MHPHEGPGSRRIELRDGRVVKGRWPRASSPCWRRSSRTSTAATTWKRRAPSTSTVPRRGPVGRSGRLAVGPAVGPRHRAGDLLVHERGPGHLCVCWSGRTHLPRRPGRRLLARFGRQGKDEVTVRTAMSHRAGLASLDPDFTLGEVLAWEPVIRAIEEQRPHHPPGAGHVYHAFTYGWIVGEIIRRSHGMLPGERLPTRHRGPAGAARGSACPPRRELGRLDGTAPSDEDSSRPVRRRGCARRTPSSIGA